MLNLWDLYTHCLVGRQFIPARLKQRECAGHRRSSGGRSCDPCTSGRLTGVKWLVQGQQENQKFTASVSEPERQALSGFWSSNKTKLTIHRRAGIVMQRGKLLLMTLASHIGVPVGDPAALLPADVTCESRAWWSVSLGPCHLWGHSVGISASWALVWSSSTLVITVFGG